MPKRKPNPTDLSTLYQYIHHWRVDGTWERLNRELWIEARQSDARENEPSAAILVSQSIICSEISGARGMMRVKINVIKRYLQVDTLGGVMQVVVSSAAEQNRGGARIFLELVKHDVKRLCCKYRNYA